MWVCQLLLLPDAVYLHGIWPQRESPCAVSANPHSTLTRYCLYLQMGKLKEKVSYLAYS